LTVPPPPLDLEAFKETPPYASALFGVYKPLLGWRARQPKLRIDLGRKAVFIALARAIAADRGFQREVDARPRPVTPDDRMPARAPELMASPVASQVAKALGTVDTGGPSRDTNWQDVVGRADLETTISGLARSLAATAVGPPDGLVVVDRTHLSPRQVKAIAAQEVSGTRFAIARADGGTIPAEWQVHEHGLIFVRSDVLTKPQLDALQAQPVKGTHFAITTRATPMQAKQVAYEAALGGMFKYVAEKSPSVLEALFAKAPWAQLLKHLEPLDHFDPAVQHVVLSPVGIVDVFREYFFEFDTFLGPPVSHVWVSPGGGVELFEVHTRRTREERELELTTEMTTRTEKEVTEEDELSTAIADENSRDLNMGVSANANADFGVVSVGGEAHMGLDLARKTSQEDAHKHSRRQSEKVTNEIRRSFRTTFRTTVESEDTSSRRYVLQNDGNQLLNYELRRKMRRVGVQVEHIGTMLCWQVHVNDPGAELGIAELVHVAKPDDFAANNPPPEAPPKLDPKTAQLVVEFPYQSTTGADDEDDVTYYKGDDQEGGLNDNDFIVWQKKFKAAPPGTGYTLADVKEVSVDRIDPDEDMPQVAATYKPVDETTFEISLDQVNFNDQPAIRFVLELIWDPPEDTQEQQAYKARLDKYTEQSQRAAQAELVKAVRERVKLAAGVTKRPSDDLRKEERTAIFRRMMSQLTQVQIEDSPHITAELVRAIFDIDKMLYFVAPDWWVPRKRIHQHVGTDGDKPQTLSDENRVTWGGTAAVGRDNYLITEDSEPAPLGSSLGWLLQLDGDEHRNAFLNSAWALAVLPIREGKEVAALNWLQLEHVEGTDGLDAAYGGPEPELKGKTLGEALETLAERLRDENTDTANVLATEQVYEKGFDPLEGGFKATGSPYELFDQWIEILPTEQVVAVEYEPKI
jgi:hypothetical protein